MPTRVPSYRHHKPSGQAVVTLNGRDIYLGKHDTAASRAEYQRVVTEWLATGGIVSPGTQGSDLTVTELAAAYVRYAKDYYVKNGQPTSEQDRIAMAVRPLKELYGRTFAKDFGPLSLKAVREKMIELGWCRNTVNSEVGLIKRLFRWAVENELVPPSLYNGLAAVAGLRQGRSGANETAPVRPVPAKNIEAVLPYLPPQIVTMIQLQRLTGMRPGEVRLMRRADLTTTGRCWEYRPSVFKTQHRGGERVIRLGPKAQKLLKPILKPELQAYLFTPEETELTRSAERRRNRVTPMTPSQAMRRRRRNDFRAYYGSDSYARVIRRACQRAGVPPWYPNQLRHNAATDIRRQCGLEAAKVMLGHKKTATTEIYAEKNEALAVQVAKKYG